MIDSPKLDVKLWVLSEAYYSIDCDYLLPAYLQYPNYAHSLGELDKDELLRRAYRHEHCDARTMELYFYMLLDALDWGAHHFPEGCLIERSYYNQLTSEARDVREKHEISERLNLEFENLYDTTQVLIKKPLRLR
jgi:hypothetical protein